MVYLFTSAGYIRVYGYGERAVKQFQSKKINPYINGKSESFLTCLFADLDLALLWIRLFWVEELTPS